MFVFVSRRFRGVGAPLSAPRAGATGMATGMATGLSVFQICKKNTPVSQSENQNQKGLHRPGIEPGSVPWQGTILPLDHRCFGLFAHTAKHSELILKSFTRFAIFGIINGLVVEKCQSVSSLRCLSTEVLPPGYRASTERRG